MTDTPESTSQSAAAMCCAQFYEQDIVRELMGDSFHPGGPALSQRLVRCLSLPSESQALDIACGLGGTTRFMAELGVHATGLDFSEVNIDRATQTTNEAESLEGSATFQHGSADALPFDDASLDAVTCECAVSTFENQAQVAAEVFRVLKPGGVFGMTDMVVNGELPADVAASIAPWTCLAQAHPINGYQRLFLDAGFSALRYVDVSETLLELVSVLKRKLVMAGMGKLVGALGGLELDIPQMRALLAQAVELVNAGTVQYAMLVFSKGNPTHTCQESTTEPSCC
jgi:ubiquinone/menaquinone biosynthesis C-methylase UbiE